MNVQATLLVLPAILSTLLATLLAAAPARADVPAAPAQVRRQRLNDEQVRITWLDKSDDEDGFEVLRRPVTEEGFELRGTVDAGVTTFVDEAPRGTMFIYRVRSFNEDGDSGLSNECYVNRPAPPVPLYFNVRLIALTVMRLAWHDRSDGEKGFEVQRSDDGKPFRTIARVPANTEEYDDYTLDPVHTYTYRVRALGRTGICWDNSRFTPERTDTTKGGVRILQVELLGRGKGKVVSDPPGISCGPKDDHCMAEFPLATDVLLTATPNDASHFGTWSGILRCEGSKAPCLVHMGQNRLVGASFKPNR